MAAKSPKGLGRGLDAIFDDNTFGEEAAGGVKTIRISSIDPKPDQPRKKFEPEALAQLVCDICYNNTKDFFGFKLV